MALRRRSRSNRETERSSRSHTNISTTDVRWIAASPRLPVDPRRQTVRPSLAIPMISYATAGVNLGSVSIEHQLGQLNLRNSHSVWRLRQVLSEPSSGRVNADQTLVSISGYNNATQRRNLFNQTDVTGVVFTGRFRHTILMGTEFGRQTFGQFPQHRIFRNVRRPSMFLSARRVRILPVAFQPVSERCGQLRHESCGCRLRPGPGGIVTVFPGGCRRPL